MLDDRCILERGQDPGDTLQDLQLYLFSQACVEIGALDEIRTVHGEDHLAVLLGEDPVVPGSERMERQVARHLCTQTLGEEGAAADLATELGARFSCPRARGEHHRIGLEFFPRCEPSAGNPVAFRREAHDLSPHDLGAHVFRSLGHGESELVGLHLSRMGLVTPPT